MSKGPGRVERIIEAAFTANPTKVFTVEELAQLAYPNDYTEELYAEMAAWAKVTGSPELTIAKKHRVSVLRAARKVARRLWWTALSYRIRERFNGRWVSSGRTILVNALDLRAYATGQSFHSLRSGKHLDPMTLEQAQPGGKWWVTVELAKARKDGNRAKATELEDQLQAIEKAEAEAQERYMAPMIAYYEAERRQKHERPRRLANAVRRSTPPSFRSNA